MIKTLALRLTLMTVFLALSCTGAARAQPQQGYNPFSTHKEGGETPVPEAPKKTPAQIELEKLMADALEGDALAQVKLGFRYREALGIDMNYKLAAKWFEKSAEQGNAAAQYALGSLYRRGAGMDKDHEKANEWLTKAAENGFPIAMYTLASMYERGEGGRRSDKEAYKWYMKAAQMGENQSQYALGAMYRDGRGVPVDSEKSRAWFDLAKNRGVVQGVSDTLANLERAANNGDPVAQNALAAMYRDGDGIEPNAAAAHSWFQRAAKQGYYPAQAALGVMYWQGFGVPRDVQEGYYWLCLATRSYPKYEDLRDRIKERLTKTRIEEAQTRAGKWYPVDEVRFTEQKLE